MLKQFFDNLRGSTASVKSQRSSISLSDACVPEDSVVYAIGDIHGRSDLLSSLLVKIENDWHRHSDKNIHLVFLGDYVDRGLHSRQVLEIIVNLDFPNATLVPLKGNHEDAMLGFLDSPLESVGWLQYGGTETLLSYGVSMPPGIPKPKTLYDTAGALREALPESHWRFLNGLQYSFTLGDFLFVHAGINPDEELSNQSLHDLLWIRGAFMNHSGLYEKVVVHGHTITDTVEFKPNRISLDTGAYYSNQLSCLVLEGNSHQLIATA